MISRRVRAIERPWTLVLWWAMLLLMGGCEPTFTDQTCSTDADCFGDEVCTSQKRCERQVASPSIQEFSSSQTLVQPAGMVTLSWRIEGASEATITSADYSLTIPADELAAGSAQVQLQQTQTFTLTAFNGQLTDAKTLRVEVRQVPAPVIDSFVADPTMVRPNQPVRLSWRAQNGMSGTLTGAQAPMTLEAGQLNEGSLTVNPAQTTTYRLTIQNLAGEASREVVVMVAAELPVISSFTASPAAVNEGEPVTLAWQLQGATSVSIQDAQQQQIDVTGKTVEADSVTVTPTRSTTYTLTARNDAGQITRQAMVTVRRDLAIDSFTASPDMIRPGQASTLAWQIAGELTNIELRDDLNNVIDTSGVANKSGGSVQVRPSEARTYTLTATGPNNATASATASVGILPDAPTISAFSAQPAQVATGAMATLSWSVQGAQTLTLTDDRGMSYDISARSLTQDTLQVTVPQTTRYTLVATNATGMDSADALVMAGSPVTITSFNAAMMSVTQGQSVELSWVTQDATSVTVMASDGAMISTLGKNVGMDSVSVRPSAPGTTYTLIANGFAGPVSATVTVTVTGATVSVDTLTASPNPAQRGAPVTLAWTTSGAASATMTFMGASGATGSVDLMGKVVSADSVMVTPTEDTTYMLTVTDAFGNTATRSVQVSVFDVAAITSWTATPDTIIAGQTVTLAWTTTAAASATLTRSDANGMASIDLMGKMVAADSVTVTPMIGATYTLVVTDTRGNMATASVTVTVTPAARIVSFTATPDTITTGGTTTLAWTAQHATSVTMTATDSNGASPVNLMGKMPNGDSLTVSPTQDTTYRLEVSDGFNTTSTTVSVVVMAPPPAMITAFGASPTTITAGGMTTLSWTTQHATGVSMTAMTAMGSTPVDLTGKMVAADSITLSPTVTTTYTLTATDGTNSPTATATVTVTQPAPTLLSFTATPDTITAGGMTTLAWTAQGATSVTMTATDSNGTSPVNLMGKMPNGDSLTVTPAEDTLYELTVTNAAGSDDDLVLVTVNAVSNPVSVTSFTASKMTTISGEAVTLSWVTQHATGVTLTDDLGNSVDLTGKMAGADSVRVFPQATRTYTLSAAGAMGPATSAVTITVNAAPLLITEVLYDATGADVGFEWLEIYNAGDTFVDLSEYSVGSGGTSYTFTRFGLSGVIPPGGCFVIGEGGVDQARNGIPAGFVYDQVISFGQGFQNGVTPGDGVGLFFTKTVTASSVPIDAVIYGTNNASGLIGEDGMPKTEISPAAPSGQSIERTSGTSDVFRVQATPTPGRCFSAETLATTRSPNDAAGVLSLTGFALDFDRMEVKLGSQTLTGCAQGMPGQYTCPVAATMQTGLVALEVSQVSDYVRDANGDAVLQARMTPITQTKADAFFFEGRLDDPGFNFYCGILDPGMMPQAMAGSDITVEMQVYLAGSTEAGGDLPAGYLVQAGEFTPNAIPYTIFGGPTWVNAAKVRNQGNDAIYAATLSSATAQTREVGYRISPDGGVNFYYCDRSGAPMGSENGWDVGGGLLVQWLP